MSMPNFISLAVVVVIGLGISLTVFFMLQASERAKLQSDFASLALDRAQAIQAVLSKDTAEMQLIASYVSASDELMGGRLGLFATEFGKVVGRVPGFEPDFSLFAFVAYVVAREKDGFEALERSELDKTFRLLERGSSGDAAPAARRAEYFPVALVEPDSFRPGFLGFDLAASPILKDTIERAIASGIVTVSGLADHPALLGQARPLAFSLGVPRECGTGGPAAAIGAPWAGGILLSLGSARRKCAGRPDAHRYRRGVERSFRGTGQANSVLPPLTAFRSRRARIEEGLDVLQDHD
jgi:hypothetical protein